MGFWKRVRSWGIQVIAFSAFAQGCGGASPSSQTATNRGERLTYSIPAITTGQIDSRGHRGRVTVLLFVTTFDVFSQAEAQRLEDLYKSHQPRLNAAAVIMEPPKNLELAQAFVEVLKLSYPVGMADPRDLRRQGVLGEIQTVPAWLILDADGYLVATGLGSLTLTQLEEAVVQAER